jgi:hypothetical protein
VAADDVAWITQADMIEVDRVMIEDLRIGLIQMMENAGRGLARLVLEASSPDSVAVAVGSGGNGHARVRRPRRRDYPSHGDRLSATDLRLVYDPVAQGQGLPLSKDRGPQVWADGVDFASMFVSYAWTWGIAPIERARSIASSRDAAPSFR